MIVYFWKVSKVIEKWMGKKMFFFLNPTKKNAPVPISIF